MTVGRQAATEVAPRWQRRVAAIAATTALGAAGPALAVWSHGPDGRAGALAMIGASAMWAIVDRSRWNPLLRATAGLVLLGALVAVTRPRIGVTPALVTASATWSAAIVTRPPLRRLGAALLIIAGVVWCATTSPVPVLLLTIAASATRVLDRWAPAIRLEASLVTVERAAARGIRSAGLQLRRGADRLHRSAQRAARALAISGDRTGSTLRRAGPGSRWAELGGRERALVSVVVLAACSTFVVGALSAAVDGWHPVGDDALLRVGAQDVGTSDTPALGMETSSGRYLPGVSAYHPGPLVFMSYAPFVRGWDGSGLLVAVAVLSSVGLVGAAYTGLRLEGPSGGVLTIGAGMAAVASVGGSAYVYRPLNAVVVLVPAFWFLVLSWALLRRRVPAAVPWVLTGSFVVQGDLQWAPALGLAALVVVWDRAREVGLPAPPVPGRRSGTVILALALVGTVAWRLADGSRPTVVQLLLLPLSAVLVAVTALLAWWALRIVHRLVPSTPEGRRWAGLAAATAAACWALPVTEAAANRGGNLWALIRVVREANVPTIGLTETLRESAATLVFLPRTVTSHPPGTLVVGAGALVMIAFAVLVISAWSHLTGDRRRMVALAVASVLGAVVGLARFPAGEGFTSFRILPVSTAAAFLLVTVATIGLDRWPLGNPLPVLGGVALATVALTAAQQPLQERREYGEWTYHVAPELEQQLADNMQLGAYQVQFVGPRSFRLLRDAVSLAIDGLPNSRTDVRRSPSVEHSGPRSWDGQVLVVPAWVPAPPGWDRVAASSPRDTDPGGAIARDAAHFLRENKATLTGLAAGSVARDPGLRSLFCPELAFDPTVPCEAADAAVADEGLGALPEWAQAVMLVEQFDEQQQSPLLRTPRPPDELLTRLRDAYEELPVSIYARRNR